MVTGGVPDEGRCKTDGKDYLTYMIALLTVLVALAMLGTLGVLFAGMLGVIRGNPDPHRSNRLMRWRVILQGVSLLLFILLLSLLKS
jgi:hypothetical protein